MHKRIIAQPFLHGVDTESRRAEQQTTRFNRRADGRLQSAGSIATVCLFAAVRARALRSCRRALCPGAQSHNSGLIIAALCNSLIRTHPIRISCSTTRLVSSSGILLHQIARYGQLDKRAMRIVSAQQERLPLVSSHWSAARRGANPSLMHPVHFSASTRIKRGANEAKRPCLLSYDLPQRRLSLPTRSATANGSRFQPAENRWNGNL
jgi:hypothetical protein